MTRKRYMLRQDLLLLFGWPLLSSLYASQDSSLMGNKNFTSFVYAVIIPYDTLLTVNSLFDGTLFEMLHGFEVEFEVCIA